MSHAFPKTETRQAIIDSLPENDQAAAIPTSEVAFTYVPPSHAIALDPENTLVEGIRGSGKSFWWAALNSSPHRVYIASVFPEARISDNLVTSQAFGTSLSPRQAPSRDVLAKLSTEFDPRHIWQAVIATHLNFPDPFPTSGRWRDKSAWVAKNPEEYDELLYAADEATAEAGKTRVILFDALDRLANDWPGIRPLARALFQVALDMRATRAIRAKLFLRPDMLEDREILAFPDASKLLARKVQLSWRRLDLYALLFQCLGNSPNAGESFRNHCAAAFDLKWQSEPGSATWVLPSPLRRNEDMQKRVFHAIAGPAMARGPSGHKRGFPYTWLPNHLLDGRDQVSPRSYTAALRHAAQEESPDDWPYALYFKGIQSGVREASRIRVDEMITEDYPWVRFLMEPLRGQLTVPCTADDIERLWRDAKAVKNLRDSLDNKDLDVKLPPQHLAEGTEGLFRDLQELGLIHRLTDGRIQMPDVYRIAFGLGRRGGVRPLK